MENKALQQLEKILIYLKHFQDNEIHLVFGIELIRSNVILTKSSNLK